MYELKEPGSTQSTWINPLQVTRVFPYGERTVIQMHGEDDTVSVQKDIEQVVREIDESIGQLLGQRDA